MLKQIFVGGNENELCILHIMQPEQFRDISIADCYKQPIVQGVLDWLNAYSEEHELDQWVVRGSLKQKVPAKLHRRIQLQIDFIGDNWQFFDIAFHTANPQLAEAFAEDLPAAIRSFTDKPYVISEA